MELSFDTVSGIEFFTITKVEQTTSKSGDPMVVIRFCRNDGLEVKQYYLLDHINPSVVLNAKNLLKKLATEWDLVQNSKVDLKNLVGKTYTAELTEDNGFSRLNRITKFIPPSPSSSDAPVEDNDIPF